MSLNAAIRGDFARVMSQARKELDRITRDTTGADSEPVKEAAKVLTNAWRRTLRTPASSDEEKAVPGAPPRKRRGILARSIKNAVVDGTRRIGSNDFRTRLFEYGYNAVNGTPIAPHPHARVALEISKDAMVEITVGTAQKRIAQKR